MKVKAITLGCKVNTYESEYVLSSFKDKGYIILDNSSLEQADIYVVNTCSVTNQSDAKSRKVISRIHRENPQSIIVVMGCFIEAHKDYNQDGINIIIGNKDKNKVVELVEEYLKNNKPMKRLYKDFDNVFEDMFITNMFSHTRAYVKIQDGCENFCSYCIIPYTRGKCRSKKPEEVLKEIKALVDNSYQEVVLTGIHTGHYGSDIETSFCDLLNEIVKIKGLKRLRISSIEITELNDEFLKILRNNPIIVDHLHIPLQSGSDTILKLMNRKYDLEYYRTKVKTIRSIRPNISITTDVIVGFPYETERLFQETLSFCEEMAFSKIHVFPYSRRLGTKADLMKEQVDEYLKKERVERLIALSNKMEHNYLETFISKDVEVLIETSINHLSIGHTGNYLKVEIKDNILSNTMVIVRIREIKDNYLIGEVL